MQNIVADKITEIMDTSQVSDGVCENEILNLLKGKTVYEASIIIDLIRKQILHAGIVS